MKKALSLTLTLLMLISAFAIFGSVNTAAIETGYDRGYKETMAGTGKIVSKGLDISEHQKGMNIQKIKDAGFDYVILRAGVKLNAGSNRKDYNFEEFYAAARKAGLDIGTYYYSQAKSVAEAKEEAKCFIEYIKGKKFEYPVYLDYESSSARDAIGSNASKAAEICYAFMDTMRDAGYLVGLYGYAAWFDPGYGGWMANQLDNNLGKKYEFWMANYFNNMLPENDRTSNYKNKYGMYQYTSSKTISGWSGKLDHNVCYKDYPSIVKKYGFNGYGSTVSAAVKYDTTKSVLKTNTTLKQGSTNTTQIKYLQKALAMFGYYKKEINGKYDTSTFSAVKAYQTSRYLQADGEAGESTLSSIVDEVMYAQAALKYLGYFSKTVNGDANDDLTEAVKWFQATEGLKKSGTLNAATIQKLEKVVDDKAAGKKVNKPIDKSELEEESESSTDKNTESESLNNSENVSDNTDDIVDSELDNSNNDVNDNESADNNENVGNEGEDEGEADEGEDGEGVVEATGCGASVTVAVVTPAILAAGALVFVKKKKED